MVKTAAAFSPRSSLRRLIASVFLPFDPVHTEADYDRVKEEEIDKLVDAGEIGPNQRGRVLCFRWMTAEENEDRVRAGISGPVPEPSRCRDAASPAPMSTVVDIEPQPSGEDERSAKFNRPSGLP